MSRFQVKTGIGFDKMFPRGLIGSLLFIEIFANGISKTKVGNLVHTSLILVKSTVSWL